MCRYDARKEKMVRLAVRRLEEAFQKWKEEYDVSAYWESSVDVGKYKDPLDKFYTQLPVLMAQKEQSYILWGLTCHAEEIYLYTKKHYPMVCRP